MRSCAGGNDFEATAREAGLALSQTAEFKFRRRYNLPPTDPRFLNATPEAVILDLWAHAHTDDPNLRNEIVDPFFAEELAAMEAEMAAAVPAQGGVRVVGEEDWTEVFDDRYDNVK